jgi:SAM-dependent methyltransferase
MSIEQAYYEIEDFWTDEMFADHQSRFKAVLDLIPADARSLIDVGCGNGAFVHFVADSGREFDELHATDRSATALSRVRISKTPASIDDLPFADSAFDAVTCLEVIEHLPLGIYEKALANICRIARKYVIIGVPFEEDIEADLVRCPSCTGRFNPDYHLRRYTQATLDTLLSPHNFKPVRKVLNGGMARYFLLSEWMDRRRRAKRVRNPFTIPIPCPMCGFTLPPAESGASAHPSPPPASQGGGLKGVVKKLLRTGTKYGGIAMLYQRVP